MFEQYFLTPHFLLSDVHLFLFFLYSMLFRVLWCQIGEPGHTSCSLQRGVQTAALQKIPGYISLHKQPHKPDHYRCCNRSAWRVSHPTPCRSSECLTASNVHFASQE